MVDPNPIRDDEGQIPEISAHPDTEWTGWFGLNVDVARLHVEAEFFAKYGMESRDEETEPRTPSGRFEDGDWAADHDWYRLPTHWRGWIPIKDFEEVLPTPAFLDFDQPAPCFENIQGLWYLSDQYSTDLSTRFEILEDVEVPLSG